MNDDRVDWGEGGPSRDALDARLRATERGYNELGRRLDGLVGMVTDVAKDLSAKIERLATYTASRPTNWYAFYGAAFALGSLALGIGVAVVAPINSDISKNAAHIDKTLDALATVEDKVEWKSDFRDYVRQSDEWMTALRDRQRTDEDRDAANLKQLAEDIGRLDERTKINHENAVRDSARLQTQIDATDLQLVKRPEIEAANRAESDARASSIANTNARIDALSARINGVQTDIHNMFPPSKIIDEIWALLRDALARAAPSRGSGGQ